MIWKGNVLFGCFLLLGLSAGPGAASADDDPDVAKAHGYAVHLYLSGNHRQAWEWFKAAMDAGSKDPRCHYYSGLNHLKLEREPEAVADFKKAAELEVTEGFSSWAVNKSLERIQGPHRALLEKHRLQVKTEAARRLQRRNALRYEQLRENEAQVLLKPPSDGKAPAKNSNVKDDPFVDKPADDKKAPAEEKPATEKPGEEEKKPAEEKKSAEEKPAAEQPAAEKPAAEEEKPVEAKPAEEKPAEATPAAEKDPFAPKAGE